MKCRGDQAFCSAECRYQQIVIDELKERRALTVAETFLPYCIQPSPQIPFPFAFVQMDTESDMQGLGLSLSMQ